MKKKTLNENTRYLHTQTQIKKVYKRLNSVIGQLNGAKRMVEEDIDCSEVLIQLSAASAAIRSLERTILKDNLENLLIKAIQRGDVKTIREFIKSVDSLIK